MYDEKFNINNFGFSYHKKFNEGPQPPEVDQPVWIYLSWFECLLQDVKSNKCIFPATCKIRISIIVYMPLMYFPLKIINCVFDR